MGEVTTTPIPQEYSKFAKGRIVIAFWLLGMCNNYIYVIMLSAAHDVISKIENEHPGTDGANISTTAAPTHGRECNELSTGAVLLADILPTLFVKLICPFLPFLVHVRMGFSISTGIAALVVVGLAENIIIALLGVAFASFNSGLGEITLLAYSTLYPLIAVAAWSSGTGGAGIVGAFAYAGMTESGLSPEMTLFISIFIPVLMAISFWLILQSPISRTESTQSVASSSSNDSKTSDAGNWLSVLVQKVKNDVKFMPEILPYMLPIGLVYFFEYLINSGLFELLEFENSSIDRSSQFRWYNVMYQVGVFVSRSSVTWIHFEKIWIMSLLQCANFIILTADAVYGFIPNVWVMFVVIFWEGLLGGAAYVNTFYNMSYQIPEERRLFALSIASVADTVGIISAGLASLPLHDYICQLPFNPIFRWPTN